MQKLGVILKGEDVIRPYELEMEEEDIEEYVNYAEDTEVVKQIRELEKEVEREVK